MSLSLNNSTILPLSDGDIFLGREYDNILDFAEINISVKCDTGYDLTYIYSQDKLTIDYQTTQSVSAQITTQFYRIPVNDRYFKLKIEATDGDMSVLNVQTIYKTSTTFNNSGAGPTSNVAITTPLNGDGSVFVGGSLTLGGTVDANITNTSVVVSGSVDANITNTSLDVNVTNTGFNCNNLPLSIVGGGVIITATDAIPVEGTILNLQYTELQAINTNTSATNTKIDATNTKLDTTNTNLTNTYNLLNTKGSAILWNNVSSGINGLSTAVNLSNIKISNMTFMGKSSGATLFTIQFSNDGITYYDSQYSYNFSGAGSFGFNINGCPNYLKMKSSNDVVANAIINYC
jgi:hypothetical protein